MKNVPRIPPRIPPTFDELTARDKASLDLFWIRDESLEDSDNLPAPGILAAEIVEDLQAALEQFWEIAEDLERADGTLRS